MINKRLFGSPIPGKVAEKLKDRQRVAGKAAPGESISGVFKDGNNVLADLSSRTPFVRMWTAVKLIDREVIQETLKEFDPNAQDEGNSQLNTATARGKATRYSESHQGTKVVEIDGKFYVKSDVEPRDQVDYATKIYTIGNHILSEINNTNPNNSLYTNDENINNNSSAQGTTTTNTVSGLFPNEQEKNDFLKPPTGITSITSNTEGPLGVIKKTSINFMVHNFNDFDKIYNRYFLKPGATIFVDFGWSTSTLYEPNDLFSTNTSIKQFLYGDPENDKQNVLGKITENQGDLEVLQGIVTNYDAKIMENGSVQCMVEITSKNSALLSFETDMSMTRNIQNILDHGILYLGVQPTLSTENIDEVSDVDEFAVIPNVDTSTDDLQRFNENLIALSKRQLGARKLTPGSDETSNSSNNTIRTGIFINSLDVDDVYISWGLFEDLIINSQFGFGKGTDDINAGDNLQVRLDSSNSFTSYSDIFRQRQRTLAVVPESPPTFILPTWWGYDIDGELSENGGSYSYQVKKIPEYPEDAKDNEFAYDIESSRIPIREVFINTQTIINSFRDNKNVRQMFNDLLTSINEDSDGVWDWKLISGDTDSELIVIDNNRIETQELINQSVDTQNENDESESKNQFFEDLFTFDVMSQNSIVKGYDINFNLPQGNIGNMYAIQGMSHENKIFPITDMIDDALALNSLDEDIASIVYLPDNGGYRADQISARGDKDASLAEIYENSQDLLSTDGAYKINTAQSLDEDILDGTLFGNQPNLESEKPTESTAEKKEREDNEKIDLNIQRVQILGYRVVSNFSDYYKTQLIQEITMKKRPNLLPITLSLTIYGISSIQPGDIFRVDYLPAMYKDKCYFQTMKVSQAIGSEGWFTTLETQFRLRPEEKKKLYTNTDISKTILSPRVLQSLNLSPFQLIDSPNGGADGGIISNDVDIRPYITNLTVKNDMKLKYINLILSFTTTSELSSNLKKYQIYTSRYRVKFINKSATPKVWIAAGGSGYIPKLVTLKPNTDYFLIIQGAESFIVIADNLETAIATFDDTLYSPYS